MSKIKLVFTRDTLAHLRVMKAADIGLSKRDCGGVLGVNLITLNRAADRAGLRDELTEIFPVSVFNGFESTKPTAKSVKRKIDEELRAEICRRHARGRSNAAKSCELNNESIALALSTTRGVVTSVSKGRTPRGIDPEMIEKIRALIVRRQEHQRLALEDTAIQIARDTGLDEFAVRNICNYVRQFERVEESSGIGKGPAWLFLTAPALNPGQCVGYY
jgi:hypothetical protein